MTQIHVKSNVTSIKKEILHQYFLNVLDQTDMDQLQNNILLPEAVTYDSLIHKTKSPDYVSTFFPFFN